MAFSSETRQVNLNNMQDAPLDVLIIGGGITGAGIALHSAAMGLRTGLVEMQDFSGGTSSRSTKLVHGGLRYLKQFEVEMVADVAKERAILHQNAPHIVKPQMMLLPVYDEPGASFTDFSAPVALDLYDELADVDPKYHHFFVSKEEVIRKEPALKKEGLIKGGIYLDYTNDDARLTIDIMKKAADLGALPVNYVKATRFLFHDDGTIKGMTVVDELNEQSYDVLASVVVNATGPWSDETRKMLGEDVFSPRMYPTKGVHFVVDHERLPVRRPIYTDTGLDDNRMIFIIPRKNKTYFGTTDTFHEEAFVSPYVTEEDVTYLLKSINNRFPEANLSLEDIGSSWAGIRPLISEKDAQDPSDISRTHDVFVSDKGLVTIAGGKLTDYRIMAEDTMVPILNRLKQTSVSVGKQVDTHVFPLSGGELPEGMSIDQYAEKIAEKGEERGLSQEDALALAHWYGSNTDRVFDMDVSSLNAEMPLEAALSLAYALQHEMALTPLDFFLRRRDYLLFDMDQMNVLKTAVIQAMKSYLKWDDTTTEKWENQLDSEIKKAELYDLKDKKRKKGS